MARSRYRKQTCQPASPCAAAMGGWIAIAHPKGTDCSDLRGIAGVAIWASTSQEMGRHIRKQINTGTFSVVLKPKDLQSGDINWQ